MGIECRGELRDVAVSVSKSEAARQSAALGLQLIAALALCEKPAYAEAAALLSQHAGDPWIDQSIAFLPNEGIDPTIEYLLANAKELSLKLKDIFIFASCFQNISPSQS